MSPVTSGVPQGSVLCPLFFLLFFNYLPCNIDSMVKLYADDALMYRSIKNASDHKALQHNLNKLAQWSTIWQLPFNLTKCEHLIVTNKPSVCQYKLKGQLKWKKNFDNMFVLSYNAQNNTFYYSIILNYRVITPQTQQNVISGKINRNFVTSTRAIA